MLINHKKDSETHRERTAVEDHCASYKIQVLREKIVDCNCCHQYRSEFGKGRALATMKRLLKMKKKEIMNNGRGLGFLQHISILNC